MKTSKFSESQIVSILKQQDAGLKVADTSEHKNKRAEKGGRKGVRAEKVGRKGVRNALSKTSRCSARVRLRDEAGSVTQ